MTDYRELCAELVERAPDARRMDGIQSWEALLARARAALAVAEPGDAQMREVIEVLADLRYSAHRYCDRGFFTDARRCTRAADLIERLASPLPGGEAKT